MRDPLWTGVLIVALGYELIARPQGRISERVWRVTSQWPLFPFAAGVIAGHFFFPDRETFERHREKR